jgi:hypothetical protein
MSKAERRRHPRVRLDGRVGGQATVSTPFKVVALSEEGAAIEMGIPLAIGARCELQLNLEAVVDVRTSVLNVKAPEQPGAPYVLGVQFQALPAGDRALLEAFLRRERGDTE